MRRWIYGALCSSLAFVAYAGLITIAGGRGDAPSDPADFPLGDLAPDGAATPEQISLLLPITDTLTTSATAECEFRETGGSYADCHPLMRIRSDLSGSPDVGSVTEGFAWPVIDLEPGTSYDFRVTVSDGVDSDVKTLTTSTRSLPAACGAANKTITAGSSSGTIATAIAGLVAGDVIQFQNGSYTVSSLTLNDNGTSNSPICIRGESRAGVTLTDTSGSILTYQEADYSILESLSLVGSGSDGGTVAGSVGVFQTDNNYDTVGPTIRNVSITDVDRCINFNGEVTSALIYDVTCEGNNPWSTSPTDFLDDNIGWNDDGVRVPGNGNAIFNVSMTGFGDCVSLTQHSSGVNEAEVYATHYYRLELRNCVDDAAEFDHTLRNVTLYDSRATNVMTAESFDPLYAGPVVIARNIYVNLGSSQMHKWNTGDPGEQSGMFVYSNTYIGTVKSVRNAPTAAQWYQPPDGSNAAYGYRNNVHIGPAGTSETFWLDSSLHNPIDWTHNSWYPDLGVQFLSSSYANLAAAKSGVANKTPVFGMLHSPSNRPFDADTITIAQPFVDTLSLPANSETEETETLLPVPEDSSLTNTGLAIPGITDGFSGAAPDRGAVIAGRAAVTYGDRLP